MTKDEQERRQQRREHWPPSAQSAAPPGATTSIAQVLVVALFLFKEQSVASMTQVEFDNQFSGKFPGQPTVLPEMRDEIMLIKKHLIGRPDRIVCVTRQAIVFWEAYSQSMDGSWLSGAPRIIAMELDSFCSDPGRWWASHPHSDK